MWVVDPLKCPHCTGEIKIINFINEQAVIRKILEHMGLWDSVLQQRPPPIRAGPQFPEDSSRQELFDDGWLGYEEPYITYD